MGVVGRGKWDEGGCCVFIRPLSVFPLLFFLCRCFVSLPPLLSLPLSRRCRYNYSHSLALFFLPKTSFSVKRWWCVRCYGLLMQGRAVQTGMWGPLCAVACCRQRSSLGKLRHREHWSRTRLWEGWKGGWGVVLPYIRLWVDDGGLAA